MSHVIVMTTYMCFVFAKILTLLIFQKISEVSKVNKMSSKNWNPLKEKGTNI